MRNLIAIVKENNPKKNRKVFGQSVSLWARNKRCSKRRFVWGASSSKWVF